MKTGLVTVKSLMTDLEHGFMIDWGNGHKKYYLDGVGYSFKNWKIEVRKYYDTEEDYLLMLLKL